MICLHNRTYYLCEYETEQKIQQKMAETDRQKEMSYWGFKFEQYMVKGKRSLFHNYIYILFSRVQMI